MPIHRASSPSWIFVPGVSLLVALIAGCYVGELPGAGGGQIIKFPPAFLIDLWPSPVALIQGGAAQTVQVQVSPANGFKGSVELTVINLPAGVTASPSSFSLTPGTASDSGTTTVTLAASGSAVPGTFSCTVEGVSGTITNSFTFSVTVTAPAPPPSSPSEGGYLVHGLYEPSRQVIFASNPILNELDVISEQDFAIKARIPFPSVWVIDPTETLVAGSHAQEIYAVDEDTYTMTRYRQTLWDSPAFDVSYPNAIAVSNGRVVLIGQVPGRDSRKIVDGGQFRLAWDQNANTFTAIPE